MKKCTDCGYKFILKDRIKAAFNPTNSLVCMHCNSKFSQSYWSSKINFFIPCSIYLLAIFESNYKFGFRFGQGILLGTINIIIAFVWIFGFTVLSQYWTKYKRS